MKQICYLSSDVMLPGRPNRRSDAYEHDLMMTALRGPLSELGMDVAAISWSDEAVDWALFDAVIIGTTWDYWDHQKAFLERLKQIEQVTQLYNPSELVAWNINKRYLKGLEKNGARLIPTLWLDRVTQKDVREAFDTLQSDDLVFKRQIGAGADGQYRLHRDDTSIPDMPHPMLVQSFLKQIQTEGELSFIFIDGALSHTLIKRAKSGDYRIQSSYGGWEEAIEPNESDLKSAMDVLNILDRAPFYARVDMLRADTGELLLMELELIEPYLYPEQGPKIGTLIAEALNARLST